MKITRREVSSDCDLPEDIHPVLRRVYAGRHISSQRDLNYSLENLLPFNLLKNTESAAELLIEAIRNGKKTVIVADYDADGATACALALRGLSLLGAEYVDYLVPDRRKHGYGLSTDVVRLALELEPDLLVTVDNGISSLDGVDLARNAGVDVLITDHHLPGETLPAASVIVNPNQPGDRFPSKCIAGVGVMLYVLLAVRAGLREAGWFELKGIQIPHFARLLDLVALGTIADVVKLDLNNRILVEQGLRRIRAGRCCHGVMALIRVARRRHEKISSSDLGFMLGPRLNAAGRLQDMSLGIECLLADDFPEALSLARELDRLNRERKSIQTGMQEEAEAHLDRMAELQQDELPPGVCLYHADWHQGIIGVLAGRIKERINRPVIVFAPGGDGFLKGSGRSLSGIHLKDVLDALAVKHPTLINSFGGHAMAAGLTIREDHYPQFQELFGMEIRRLIAERPLRSEIMTDGDLGFADFNLELAREIETAGPWGQGFPEPMFDGIFSVVDARLVGERHLKMKLLADGADQPVDAISFDTDEAAADQPAGRMRLVYQLTVDDYNDRQTPRLVVRHIQEAE